MGGQPNILTQKPAATDLKRLEHFCKNGIFNISSGKVSCVLKAVLFTVLQVWL